MERYHIVKRGEGWVLRKERASEVAKFYNTKEDAKIGAEKYWEEGHDIVVHKRDGSIEKWTKGKVVYE
jgi:hypothetical protein